MGKRPVGRLEGHQQIRENKWTSGRAGHFTASPSSPTCRREVTLTGQSTSTPTTTMTTSQWNSNFGLQTIEPRLIFSPNNSNSNPYQTSSIQRQPSNSEFYAPRSKCDFVMGSVDQRDQYAMETPLNTPLDTPLPPPPPLISGGRLAAISVLYVLP